MVTKLKSVLRIPKQQSLLAVRAAIFAAALWLLVDRDFGFFQLVAFILIGIVLYATPVFQTLLLFPSFVALMIVAPLSMAVFGPQLGAPVLLAAFFGFLFYLIIGIKQVVLAHRAKWHHLLHLALVYSLSLLFFAAPGGDWFVGRSLLFMAVLCLLLRELFLVRGATRSVLLRLHIILIAFMSVQALWVIGLLPIGFINSAGIALVFIFIAEEFALGRFFGGLSRKKVTTELATFATLMLVIFGFSTWTLP